MWCSACQQDVPRVATSSEDRTVRCARCGRALPGTVPADGRDVPFEDLPEFIELDDWDFSETIEDAERVVRNVEADLEDLQSKDNGWKRRRRSPFISTDTSSDADVAPPNSQEDGMAPRATSLLPSLVLAAGLGLFTCGAALIVLALINARPQLWQWGVPFALTGQVAVLSVVFWQLSAAWNHQQSTLATLHAADKQLRELRNDWSALQRHNAESFYYHLAQGANPEVLLADLRDQIDLLSDHMARTKRAA